MMLSANEKKHLTRNPLKKWFINRFNISVAETVKRMNPRSILDVGCGEGFLTKVMQETLPSVSIVGVDFSEEAIRSAGQRCPDLKFQVADIEKLPFETGTFDLVVCSEVLEHVINPAVAIKELCRVSNKYVLVTVPFEPWFRIINFISFNNWRNATGHINYWGRKSLREFVAPYMEIMEMRCSFPWLLIFGTSRRSLPQFK